MKKIITIKEVKEFKSGVGSGGKAWTLSNVVDSEGKKYSTFLSLVPGMTGEMEVVEEKSEKLNPNTGKPYVNFKISKVYGVSSHPTYPTGSAGGGNRANEQLDRIEKKIDGLLFHFENNLEQ